MDAFLVENCTINIWHLDIDLEKKPFFHQPTKICLLLLLCVRFKCFILDLFQFDAYPLPIAYPWPVQCRSCCWFRCPPLQEGFSECTWLGQIPEALTPEWTGSSNRWLSFKDSFSGKESSSFWVAPWMLAAQLNKAVLIFTAGVKRHCVLTERCYPRHGTGSLTGWIMCPVSCHHPHHSSAFTAQLLF